MMRSLVVSILLALASLAPAQTPGLAITNARLLPISGPAIEHGTLLMRDGKIEKLGADVTVPPGYRIVDAHGGTLMPGAVNAHAHTGLGQAAAPAEDRPNRFRRGGGRRRGGFGGGPAGNAENKSADKVIDRLYARQDVFGDVLRDGVTTLGLAPTGRGLPGQGAVVRPRGDDAAAMTVSDSAFLSFAPVADTKTKDLIRKAIEDGKRASERRKRRAAAKEEQAAEAEANPKEPSEAPAEKPAEKPKEGDKPSEKPADKPKEGDKPTEAGANGGERGRGSRPQAESDPGAEAMADLVDGKTRAFVQLDSAMDLAHWSDVCKDTSFATVVVSRRHSTSGAEGALDLALDKLKARKCTVLMSPDFDTVPNTQYVVNLAARLHAAGIEVGFLLPDQGRPLQTTRPQLMELVRAGLPAEVALRGITLTPARALGVDKLVGSLEPGKAANLLLWSADPLDPAARLLDVWLEGQEIEDDAR